MTENSVVIITGAASGIGRAIALKFALNHYALSLVDIDLPGLNKLKEELEKLPGEYLFLKGDLQDQEFVRNIISDTVQKWGRVDILINSAAWRTIETMRNISIENWEKTIKISLTAPAFLAKHAAAVMEEKKISGTIINISSVMSQQAGGYSPAYTVCKGGLESLTYELAVLYGPKGIRVIAVNPGNIHTNLSSDYTDSNSNNISEKLSDQMNEHTPLQRDGSPGEVANVCYWLSTKEASFITGTSIQVDGGFTHNFNSYQVKKLQFPQEF